MARMNGTNSMSRREQTGRIPVAKYAHVDTTLEEQYGQSRIALQRSFVASTPRIFNDDLEERTGFYMTGESIQ